MTQIGRIGISDFQASYVHGVQYVNLAPFYMVLTRRSCSIVRSLSLKLVWFQKSPQAARKIKVLTEQLSSNEAAPKGLSQRASSCESTHMH